MAKEVLKITAMDSGNKITATINDVNPEATNAQLATLGTMFTALTTNTYESSDRVTTVNVDTEPGGGAKRTPNFTLDKISATVSEIPEEGTGIYKVTPMTNSDGQLYTRYTTTTWANQPAIRKSSDGFIILKTREFPAITAQTIIFGVTETENFQGAEVEFTLT